MAMTPRQVVQQTIRFEGADENVTDTKRTLTIARLMI